MGIVPEIISVCQASLEAPLFSNSISTTSCHPDEIAS